MYKFNILPATPAEIPAIQEIISETWEPAYREILSGEQIRFMESEIYNAIALEEQMAGGQLFFILYVNQIPAGFAAFSPFAELTYKLNKIYLKPCFQGQGFGSMLIGHIEQEVLHRGGKILILNVNRLNPARYKYERLGFAIVSEEDIPIGNYWMNDFVMQKELISDT